MTVAESKEDLPMTSKQLDRHDIAEILLKLALVKHQPINQYN
jgi:hypothetical protein